MGERKIFQVKYLISGHVVEEFRYQKNQFKGFEPKNKDGKNKHGFNPSENRSITLSRARKMVTRTINSNPDLNKFLTLTFEENITDLDYSNKEFKDFIKRVNYHVFKTKKSMMKYVAVIEFQKRGAVHYHVLCNLPYIDVGEFQKIWGHGFIRLNKIKGNTERFGSNECDNVGAYVCKYMTKDNSDERLKDRRSFLMSRNLNKPTEIVIGIDEKDVLRDALELDYGNTVLMGQYRNDYTGDVIYCQYNLKRY